jgi:hypothetical protein
MNPTTTPPPTKAINAGYAADIARTVIGADQGGVRAQERYGHVADVCRLR